MCSFLDSQVYVGPLQRPWGHLIPQCFLLHFLVSLFLALPSNGALGSHDAKKLLVIIFDKCLVGRSFTQTSSELGQIKRNSENGAFSELSGQTVTILGSSKPALHPPLAARLLAYKAI